MSNEKSAVEAGGKHLSVSYEAWIAADTFRRGMRVLITGPQGFEWVVQFHAGEQPAEITRRSARVGWGHAFGVEDGQRHWQTPMAA